MTYEGMLDEVEALDEVKKLKQQLKKLKADKARGDADLEKTIDMLKKQKKMLQDSIRKHG